MLPACRAGRLNDGDWAKYEKNRNNGNPVLEQSRFIRGSSLIKMYFGQGLGLFYALEQPRPCRA